jgi:Tfp pilus assembly protein PilP
MRRTGLALLLVVGFAVAPWGDCSVAHAAPPKPPAKPAPGGKPGGKPVAAAPTATTDAAEAVQQRLAILRRKVLRDEDFNETDDANRDPFRSFTGIFSERNVHANLLQQVPSIFGKFALEELTLIAVITGDANPRAMFRDPSGLGQVIKRGDYVSKSSARVTKILSDRVVLELAEITSGGETRALEKAILVNPEGAEK